jgi:putative endonuclease
MSNPWWIYIVECSDGTYYTGITPNIEKRIVLHNQGKGAKYTAGRGPVVLRYQEQAVDRATASRREYALKQCSRVEKEQLFHEIT